MATWWILFSFGMFFTVLVLYAKKNLATLFVLGSGEDSKIATVVFVQI
jgi:hypothetical protein